MSYVPIVTTPHAPEPTRQTRELADLLGRVVQEYEKAHPTVSGAEVRQALLLAQRASTKAGGQSLAAVASVAGGLAAMMGLGIFVFLSQGGTDFRVSSGLIFGIVALLGVVAVVVAMRRAP